jgi:hypothetical protein
LSESPDHLAHHPEHRHVESIFRTVRAVGGAPQLVAAVSQVIGTEIHLKREQQRPVEGRNGRSAGVGLVKPRRVRSFDGGHASVNHALHGVPKDRVRLALGLDIGN